MPGLGLFAGRNAKTADLAKLASAEKLVASGADRRAIWDQTGWFQGHDGSWRFEIPDDASQLSPPTLNNLTKYSWGGEDTSKLAGALWHDKAYAAYPELRKTTADLSYNPYADNSAVRGVYFADTEAGVPKIEFYTNTLSGDYGPRSALLHEMQHAIQNTEDFARGADPRQMRKFTQEGRDAELDWLNFSLKDEMKSLSDPKASDAIKDFARRRIDEIQQKLSVAKSRPVYATPEEAYRAASGEIEARNVQRRMDMTPDQRRASPPWETEDQYQQPIILGLLGKARP
jgi:hypothetical protein